MVAIQGLDKLTRQLDEAGKAAKALDGDLTTVNFDPSSAASVNEAVRQMERAIDQKVSRWRGNPLVDELVKTTKATMREQSRQRRGKRDGRTEPWRKVAMEAPEQGGS